MSDGSHIATVVDYPGLQRAMRGRAEALGISRATLDALAGTHDGHAGKMLADPPSKNMGVLTFGLLLQGLGLKLIVAEDAEQMAKIAHRMEQRDANNGAVLNAARYPAIELRISRRRLKSLGKLGGKARATKLSKRRLSQIGKMGARARWAGNRPKRTE